MLKLLAAHARTVRTQADLERAVAARNRFILEALENGHTQREIGAALELSPQRVSQIAAQLGYRRVWRRL